jgi:hypothetical protein
MKLNHAKEEWKKLRASQEREEFLEIFFILINDVDHKGFNVYFHLVMYSIVWAPPRCFEQPRRPLCCLWLARPEVAASGAAQMRR